MDIAEPTEITEETSAAAALREMFDKAASGEPESKGPPAVETAQEAPKTKESVPAEPEKPVEKKGFKASDVLGKALNQDPAPPAAGEDEEIPDDVKNSTEKAQSSWRALKDQLRAKTRAEEALRKELDELRQKTPVIDPEEVQTLRQRLEEQEQTLKVTKVEATREYKEAVAQPLSQIREAARKLAEKHQLDPKQVLSALESDDAEAQAEALSDLASSLPEFDKMRLYDLVRENSRVQNLKKRVLENADEALKRIESARQQEEEKTREHRTKEHARTVDKVWRELQEAVPVFREQEGNDAWNEQIRELSESVRATDVEALDTEGRVRLATRGAVAPILLKMLQNLHAEYQQVSEELRGIREATPKAGGGTTPGRDQGTVEEVDPDAGFWDTIKTKLPGA